MYIDFGRTSPDLWLLRALLGTLQEAPGTLLGTPPLMTGNSLSLTSFPAQLERFGGRLKWLNAEKGGPEIATSAPSWRLGMESPDAPKTPHTVRTLSG